MTARLTEEEWAAIAWVRKLVRTNEINHDNRQAIICAAAERQDAELEQREADLAAAAGELLLPIPEPGTDMARLMSANRLLRSELDQARLDARRARQHADSLGEAVAAFRNLSAIVDRDGGHAQAGETIEQTFDRVSIDLPNQRGRLREWANLWKKTTKHYKRLYIRLYQNESQFIQWLTSRLELIATAAGLDVDATATASVIVERIIKFRSALQLIVQIGCMQPAGEKEFWCKHDGSGHSIYCPARIAGDALNGLNR